VVAMLQRKRVDLAADDLDSAGWPLGRRPYLFETSVPGVFAVGDIRSGSVAALAYSYWQNPDSGFHRARAPIATGADFSVCFW
jgi:thioredoxin reductase